MDRRGEERTVRAGRGGPGLLGHGVYDVPMVLGVLEELRKLRVEGERRLG